MALSLSFDLCLCKVEFHALTTANILVMAILIKIHVPIWFALANKTEEKKNKEKQQYQRKRGKNLMNVRFTTMININGFDNLNDYVWKIQCLHAIQNFINIAHRTSLGEVSSHRNIASHRIASHRISTLAIDDSIHLQWNASSNR